MSNQTNYWIQALESQIKAGKQDINLDRKSSIETPIGNGEILQLICEKISKNSTYQITSLSLCGQEIDDSGFKDQILKNLIMKENCSIRLLHLESYAWRIGRSLEYKTGTPFNLNNEITDEAAKKLMKTIKSTNLSDVFFNNKVPKSVKRDVSKFLQNLPAIGMPTPENEWIKPKTNKDLLIELQKQRSIDNKEKKTKNKEKHDKILEALYKVRAEQSKKRIEAARLRRSLARENAMIESIKEESDNLIMAPKESHFEEVERTVHSGEDETDEGREEISKVYTNPNSAKKYKGKKIRMDLERSGVELAVSGSNTGKKIYKNNEKDNWKDQEFINAQVADALDEEEGYDYEEEEYSDDPKKVY